MEEQCVIYWLRRTVSESRGVLRPEAAADVIHYLSHSELEMAFELLVLELMDLGVFKGGEESLRIARFLGLDQDFHYDEKFWEKLNSYEVKTSAADFNGAHE